MSQLARWWWIIPICVILVALAAVSLSSHKLSDPRAVVRVHAQDTTVSYQFSGEPQPFTPPRSVNDLAETDFVDPQTAQVAAAKLGGISGQQLIDHLGFAALSGNDLQLSYSDGSAPTTTAQRLKMYAATLVSQRVANERKALDQAADTLAANNGDVTAVARLRTAAGALGQQIHTVGTISVSSGRTIPKAVLLAGGALAGAILGVLIALAVAGADPRIRSLSDLRYDDAGEQQDREAEGKGVRDRVQTSMARSAPATPAKADETPNAIVLYVAGLTPDAVAAISPSRIARHARPVRPLTRSHAARKRIPAVTQAS